MELNDQCAGIAGATMHVSCRRTDVTSPTLDPGGRRADAVHPPSDAGDPRLSVSDVPMDAGDRRLGNSVYGVGLRRSSLGHRGMQRWAAGIGAPRVEDSTARPKHRRSEVRRSNGAFHSSVRGGRQPNGRGQSSNRRGQKPNAGPPPTALGHHRTGSTAAARLASDPTHRERWPTRSQLE